MSEHTDYMVALDFLVKQSKWTRAEVVADGTSAGWFCAQRANTPAEAAEAQRYGVVVAKGRPA